jgi:predicted MarR family transcription regulator
MPDNGKAPEDRQAHRELDYRWHLAKSDVEVSTTELEFALMRTFEGFGRWQSECLAGVVDLAASGPENALLHIIRMNERPKTIKDLARMTNRDDVPNIQYSLRKLIGAESGAPRRIGTLGRHLPGHREGPCRHRSLWRSCAGAC